MLARQLRPRRISVININSRVSIGRNKTIKTIEPIKNQPIQTGSGVHRNSRQSGSGVAQTISNMLTVAKTIDSIAFGPIGTAFSNTLSRKFNKNPEWKTGFSGEKHLVLPTEHGLTRTNWAGPGTNIRARLKRGDVGVDGRFGVDIASKRHDIAYATATNEDDVRRADLQYIREVEDSTQSNIVKQIITKGILAKTIGEDLGIINPSLFTPQLGQGQLKKVSEIIEDLPCQSLKRSLIKNIKKLRKKKLKIKKSDIMKLSKLLIKKKILRVGLVK